MQESVLRRPIFWVVIGIMVILALILAFTDDGTTAEEKKANANQRLQDLKQNREEAMKR